MTIVVLFKSESDGPDKFQEQLESKGFDVRIVYCINFQFKNTDKLLENLRKADDYEGLIFTSPRAVHGVQKAVETQPDLIRDWEEKRNYSVGESTSELSLKLLNLVTEGGQSGNAQQLSSLIIADNKETISSLRPFLFPSGNLKQETLQKTLKESAIQVTEVEIYETIDHPEMEKSILDLLNLQIDFIVYFSPSGIKFSLPIMRKYGLHQSNAKIIAIGPSTKKSLEENGLKCFGMCKNPTPGSLMEVLSRS